MKTQKFESIETYIASFPAHAQDAMKSLRNLILTLVPDVEEKISYDMPSFFLSGKPLVYFAAYKLHIGFYGVPTDDSAFKEDFSGYKIGRGSIQFPLHKAMPLDLVTRVVKHRVKEAATQTPKS